MDHDDEIAKFKWLLIAVAAFLFSAYFSYNELKYAVWGATTEATITRTFETANMGRRGRRTPLLAVEYTFTDEEGNSLSERDDVPLDWPVSGERVNVQYLPGVEDSSRLEGHSRKFAVWLFLGCCGFLGFSGFKLYREASEAVHGKRGRR